MYQDRLSIVGVGTLCCVSASKNTRGIFMLNLSMVKDIKDKRTESDWSWAFIRDEELGVLLSL